MDGVDHPNIIRACFVHPRYFEGTGPEWTTGLIQKRDLLLSLWLLAVQARNEGLAIDLARFCTNVQFSDQASSALLEAGKMALWSIRDMPSTRSPGSGFMLNALSGAASFAYTFGSKVAENAELLGTTRRLARDSDAHSVIHQDADVYRFAFTALLSRFDFFEQNAVKNEEGSYQLDSPTLRRTFNVAPVTEEDWKVLHESLDEINRRGSPALKGFLASIEAALNQSNPLESLVEADFLLQKELQTRMKKRAESAWPT